MPREAKATSIADLVDGFQNSTAALLTEYRGLTVAEISALRRSLRGVATYAVVKNTLTRIAAREAGVEGIEDLLVGPSAIAFVTGDPVEAAKGLRDFAKDKPALVLKGGYMDGRVLGAADLRTLADLESREVLLAKLAGAMKASMNQAAALFVAPMAQAARVLGALQEKVAADPAAAGAAAPPAAAEPAAEPAAETTPEPAPEPAAETTPEPAAAPEASDEGSTEG